MPSPSRSFMTSRAKPARLLLALSLAFSAAVSSVFVASPVLAQTTASVADYVPASALLYAEFQLDQDSDQFALATELVERTNLASLLPEEDAASVEETVDTLGLAIDGEAAVFVSELPIEEFLETSEMVADATDLGTDPLEAVNEEIPAGWAVVLHPSDAEQAFGFYESLVFGDEDAVITDSTYGGFDIQTNEPVDESSTPMSMALVGDVIVLASIADDIHPVIDAANGDVEVLSESESFSEVRGTLANDLLSFVYLNSPAIMDEVIAAGGESALEAIESQGTSLAFYQGIAVWAADEGFRIDTASLPVDPADLPEAVAYANTFAETAPSGALLFSGGMDLGTNPGIEAAALLIAQGVIAEQSGIDVLATPMALDPEAAAEEVFAEAEATLGFNIQTDVLDALSGEWAATASVGDLTSEAPEFSALFLSDVTDEASISAVLAELTDQIETASAESQEEVTISTGTANGADTTIITVDNAGFPLSLEYGVVDSQLAISLNQPLETALADQTESLASSDLFAQTFEALPQENLMSVAYLDVIQLVPTVQDLMGMSASSTSSEDADPECANYGSQDEAQTAYDEDNFELWNLDLDFDGEACEDFFASDVVASPVATEDIEIGLLSIGTVTYSDGSTIGSSTVILIDG